jgi:Circadian oscillating protein COP23
MKWLLPLALFLSSVSIVANTIAAKSQAKSQDISFVCSSSRGVPTTIAQTPVGETPVIRWVNDSFDEYDPQTRCELVSAKFQQYYREGTLKHLTTGRKNGENIVCVAAYENGPCAQQLFTLKSDSNPSKTLAQLINIRDRSGRPINQSNERLYVNIEELLNQAVSTENNSSNNSSIEPNNSQLQTKPAIPSETRSQSGSLW